MRHAGNASRYGRALALLFVAMTWTLSAAMPDDKTATLLQALKQQNVPEEAVMGIDRAGVPMVCGTGFNLPPAPDRIGKSDVLPAGVRSWECIPSVIRNDGTDWFRLEVDVNGPVSGVLWRGIQEYYITSESGTNFLWLRDDGLGGDRIARDYIYTSERCRYRAEIPMAPTQNYSTNTPAGIYISHVGDLVVNDTNGTQNAFLIAPGLAVLNTNVPLVETVLLATNIQVSAHMINVATTNREAQKTLRIGNYPYTLTGAAFSVLPDAFDFIGFFTTDHLEYIPQTASPNFIEGVFYTVSVNFSGTGQSLFNHGTTFGSAGRLKGAAYFDTMERGIGYSQNTAHEISHEWSAYVSTSLGITTGDGHYSRNCSINSILGGLYKPTPGTNGSILRDCYASDFYEATPLDKYMMGLISTSAVPPLYVSSNILAITCGSAITNLRPLVTISNIVALHGIRTPGPATAQKNFSICFATGSHNRLLNATEMTFFDLMAEHFTKPLPESFSPPDLIEGWVPISRFFGEGTTWSSEVLGLIRPTITGVQSVTNGFRISGAGYPGRAYRLLATSNFVQWTSLSTNTAGINGTLAFQDNSQLTTAPRFFRISTQ
jgi:hypothetical protein